MSVRTCLNCLNSFYKEDPRTVFCSQKCYFEKRKQETIKRMNKICPSCKNEFIAKKKNIVYCSKKCGGKARERKIKKECEICKKSYNIVLSAANSSKFCSKECYQIYHKQEKFTTKCIECEVDFIAPVYTKNRKRFCSRKCHAHYRLKTRTQKFTNTSIEIKIKNILEKINVIYIEQKRFGIYTADFFLPDFNLIIECDGLYWHNTQEALDRDKRKNQYYFENNFRVLRLKEETINDFPLHCESVIEKMIKLNKSFYAV